LSHALGPRRGSHALGVSGLRFGGISIQWRALGAQVYARRTT